MAAVNGAAAIRILPDGVAPGGSAAGVEEFQVVRGIAFGGLTR